MLAHLSGEEVAELDQLLTAAKLIIDRAKHEWSVVVEEVNQQLNQ